MKLRVGLLAGTAFLAGVAATSVTTTLHPGPLARWGIIGHAAAQDGGSGGTMDMYRLLDLFGEVIERVRAEYVEPVNDRELVENAIEGMLAGLDPHSSYMNAKAYEEMQSDTRGEFGGLGLEVTQEGGVVKVITPIDDTPAARAGMKTGDLIIAVDGQTVQGMSLNEAVEKMRGPAGTSIRLTVVRQGADRPLELSLQREVVHLQVAKFRLEGDVGYIRLSAFNEQTDPALRRAVQQLRQQAGANLKGFVLDLRNNPGGLLDQAVDVSGDFLGQGEIVSIRARDPEDSQRWDAKSPDITGGLPVVVLINGGSASASEIVAGALQDHRRAVVVGTRSFGKGSVQTIIPLPGNGAMRLTTARYYTPSGRSIQGLGISPDVEVASSRAEAPHFGPEREADLNRALRNQGGVAPQQGAPARNDLPAVARDIPKLPPEGFPAFDPLKPETDFQLQQAMVVLRGMTPPSAAPN